MNAREAYEAGKDQGYSAVIYGEFPKGMDREEIASEAWEIEENARQYADHPTYDIHSDAAWEAYDRGVNVGIKQGIAARFGAKRKARKTSQNPRRRAVKRRSRR